MVGTQRNKVGFYCSDVSEAFYRVPTDRLLQKLHRKGVAEKVFKFLGSWIEER